MITDNRLKHILEVARKAKILALKFKPKDIQFAEDMFLLGMLHDIGYEFVANNEKHAAAGGAILQRSGYKYWQEVYLHGDETVENMSDELFILNCADMTTGPNGENFTFNDRLEEIADRFGIDSHACQKCVVEIEKLKKDGRYKILFA